MEDAEKIKEVILASEEVQRRNIESVIAFSKESRRIVRDLETNVKALQNQVMTQNGTIENLQKQLSSIQQKLYSGSANTGS